MNLLIGSHNPAKIAEYQRYLLHARLKLCTLKGLGIWDEPLEIGKTFLENALQKARYYAEKTEYPALADDGGLEIDALEGAPGVESRRWVGPKGTDEDRVAKVFSKLAGTPPEKRTARLKLVVVVYFPSDREYIFAEKAIEGVIPEKPYPNYRKGFPYRSVLYVPEYKKYYEELTLDEHEAVNHRHKACRELLLKLEPFLNS